MHKGLLSTSEPFPLVGLWLLTVVPACLSVRSPGNDDTAFPCSCRAGPAALLLLLAYTDTLVT